SRYTATRHSTHRRGSHAGSRYTATRHSTHRRGSHAGSRYTATRHSTRKAHVADLGWAHDGRGAHRTRRGTRPARDDVQHPSTNAAPHAEQPRPLGATPAPAQAAAADRADRTARRAGGPARPGPLRAARPRQALPLYRARAREEHRRRRLPHLLRRPSAARAPLAADLAV